VAVSLVTIHHEGAGDPTDDVQRFAVGGYSYGIGTTKWVRFRSPYVSWGTLHFNHVSMDICLSGDRMNHPVTDNDLNLIRGAFLDCHSHGEVVDSPLVRPHRWSPGSSTVCPGDDAMFRFGEITNACRFTVPPPPPPKPPVVKVEPRFDPLYGCADYAVIGGRVFILWGDGAVHAPQGGYKGGLNNNPAATGRHPARIVAPMTKVPGANPPPADEVNRDYVVIATSGERYGFS
jgi:hypothetical protein